MNKGRIFALTGKGYVPKKLTQSKLLKLLYDTTSQASSHIEEFGMGDDEPFD